MIGRPEHPTNCPEIVERYGSTGDYLAKIKPDTERGSSYGHSDNGDDWAGTPDYPTAEKLAREGWPEGREKVSKLTDSYIDQLSGRIVREDWVPDIIGNHIDMGAFLAGEPDCWRRIEYVQDPNGTAFRHASILYNGSVSCAVSREVIEARGAAIAALVDLLELAGYSTTVSVTFCVKSQIGSGAKQAVAQFITIKPSTERADLSSLMFWLAHPSALRRIAFGSWETMPEERRRKFGFYSGQGYGYPSDPDLTLEKPDVYVSSGYIGSPDGRANWMSLEATKKWLASTLKELGVELKD